MTTRHLRPKTLSGGSGRRIRATTGFTIIEVALASFVMAFGIATSIIAMQMGFKALDVARDSTLASQIMQSEIERLRLMPWTKITGGAVEPKDSITELAALGTATVDLTTMFTSSAAIGAKFTVTRTATLDGTRSSEVCYITVNVAWNSYDGRNHTRSFTTMYSKNGLYDYYYTLAGT